MAQATHYLITKNHEAISVVAADEADALKQAADMGVADIIVRVDAAMTEEEWKSSLGRQIAASPERTL